MLPFNTNRASKKCIQWSSVKWPFRKFLNEINRVKRLLAKHFIDKKKNYWNTVILTDQSNFNLFDSDSRQ